MGIVAEIGDKADLCAIAAAYRRETGSSFIEVVPVPSGKPGVSNLAARASRTFMAYAKAAARNSLATH